MLVDDGQVDEGEGDNGDDDDGDGDGRDDDGDDADDAEEDDDDDHPYPVILVRVILVRVAAGSKWEAWNNGESVLLVLALATVSLTSCYKANAPCLVAAPPITLHPTLQNSKGSLKPYTPKP